MGPKYAFENDSTYIVPYIFLWMPYVDFNLFFLAIHTPCFSIFRIILHTVIDYEQDLPRQRKRILTPL